ncbi:39 kDa FK506-binding nuclear protein [Drosophila sechellia]|uniref:peptidylprolyl isomerase n=1 Tax=Drosophila sechellia TaxID=7238 RepID=B4HDX7_DROSE|nr:39 kDa FK506-binding nuclear protein [Drosophila sechellia]EDW42069.1 GM25784 [Drosophila sechellia]
MSMFWGLNMKPERKYSQTIIKSFHISGVALDKGQEAKLYLAAEKQEYIVATVTKAIPQVALDLNFSKGDRIMFYTAGDASVSLLGYLHDIDSEDDEDDDELTIEKLIKGKNSQKSEDDEDESGEEEEESDEDSQIIGEYESFLENGEEEDDDDEDNEESGEEDEEDSDDSEAEEEQPKAKVAKLSPGASGKKSAKEQNGVAKKEEAKQQQKKKEKPEAKKEQPKAKEPAKQQRASKEPRTITGGVKIVDQVVGKGEEAKQGKRVSVYYIGRLQSNNKTFDSLLKGKPFNFCLGGGEVIKGWDVGVAGMKVGGKRVITCPPHMAYGARGAAPKIGPNSTLVFEVELKAVH